MKNWWDDPMYDYAPMDYPRRDDGPQRRITLKTDPEIRKGVLPLKNRHPHERLRIFVAPGRA